MDLHRDEAAAFGPSSFVDGGLLPYEGRQQMLLPDGLPPAVFEAEEDGWLSPNNPILVRGMVKILPLAWRGDPKSGRCVGADPEEIAAFVSLMQAAGLQWAGNWSVLDLKDHRDDNIGSYTAALRAAGATRVECWMYSEAVGLALVRAGVEDEGTMSLACHVVPVSWVFEPRSWASKHHVKEFKRGVRGIDVRWSWAEVIALYMAGQGDTESGSLDSGPVTVQKGSAQDV